MLKLPKGLKKKKKGKKSKKDQELFTEAELEQYKLQQQQKLHQPNQEDSEEVGLSSDTEQKAASAAPKADTEKSSDVDADEWSKFKALTAGVDSILHKTQDDLDRIKSTSFFKRELTPSERKKLEEEKAAALEAFRLEEERRKKEEHEANRDKLAEAVVELSESEEESEEADDIFDTGYIDVITSGEVQLAIVPDSPVLELPDDGPDPFDTSYADKLIKGPEVSKRGKKLVSLGSAVEVLTGRVEREQALAASGIKKKPRRGIQDLLLDSFDENSASVGEVGEGAEAISNSTPEPPKTLLDDLTDEIPETSIDLSVSLHLALQKDKLKEEEEREKKEESNDVVLEFDTLKQEEDDEFAELAAESLTKKPEVATVLAQPQPLEFTGEVESNWAEFEQETKEEAKGEGQLRNTGEEIKLSDDEFAVSDEADPFDTTFVEKVIPVKEEEDDFDFDPRAEEEKVPEILPIVERDLLGDNVSVTRNIHSENLLTSAQKDLLGGSTTDLSNLPQSPIAPIHESIENIETDFDPFDTSAVTSLVQPKETELKFLEEELLTDTKLHTSLSDPDFNPRAVEKEGELVGPPVVVATEFDPSRRKSSLSLNLQGKSVAFLIPKAEHEGNKIQKPLTPYYPQKETILEKDTEDLFNTSFVPSTKPENTDFFSCSELKHSLSDPDFDPRAEEDIALGEKSDFLSVNEDINTKVLTPAGDIKDPTETELDDIDPFDTSIAANILPGKTELKLLEDELLPPVTQEVTGVLDTLTDAQELGLGDKVLTPQAPSVSLEEEQIDPFDTSFANNLGPGKAEIKVLETEFNTQINN